MITKSDVKSGLYFLLFWCGIFLFMCFKNYVTIIILSIFINGFVLFVLFKCDYMQLHAHVNMFTENKILAKKYNNNDINSVLLIALVSLTQCIEHWPMD